MPLLTFTPKTTSSGPMMSVTAGYGASEDMTAHELERFADEVRAQARRLRAASDKHARQYRDPWS